jgi:hypothetical protein
MIRWKEVIKNWFLSTTECPVLVVTYESLRNDSLVEVERMLQFLNIEYDTDTLRERLHTRVFDTFYRKQHPQNFQHFTKQQTVYINNLLKDVNSLVRVSDKSHLLNVEQYIC